MLTLYNSLVLPHLMYCNVIWGNTFPSHLNKLFIVQKQVVRIISNAPFNYHTNELFCNSKILKLNDLIDMSVAIFMFNYKMNILPEIFKNIFTTNASHHTYLTRKNKNYRSFLARTTTSQHSLRFNGPKIWNNISEDLKQCSTITRFKRKLKDLHIHKYQQFTLRGVSL